MGAALILILVALGALAAGVLIGRYYVPDDRQLRRTARHSRAYMRALSHLIARDHDTVVDELRGVVEENVDDVEPYFALGALFRSRGEHERAIRVHQALALRERDRRKLKHRAMYELGLDYRAAGMPRRATKAMEEVLLEEPAHEGALRALAGLYEEQARFNESAGLWQRLGRRRGEDTGKREHHLLVAAAQAAMARDDLDSAKQFLKAAQRHEESAHFYAAAAELAAARTNHRGARERLRQALVADPALAPHLLPGLIAAEEALAGMQTSPGIAVARPSSPTIRANDDLADDAAAPTPGDESSGAGTSAATSGTSGTSGAGTTSAAGRPSSVALVPTRPTAATVAERVIALIAEIEAQTGPRLELALIRAQLAPAKTGEVTAALADDLAKFPDAIAARVATGRLALASTDAAAVRRSLEAFVRDDGALAWALRGRWQCANCGARPKDFTWRCAQCRRWATLRMETGIEPPPIQSRERRTAARPKADGLLGAAPDTSLPTPTLDPGLTEEELATANTRKSFLGRVGGWFRRGTRS